MRNECEVETLQLEEPVEFGDQKMYPKIVGV